MKRYFLQLLLPLLTLALLTAPVFAEGQPNLLLNLTLHKQTVNIDEEGKTHTQWQAVEATDPGDILRYTLHYRNEGTGEARGATFNDRVPEGTVYLPGSAEGKDTEVTFSLDGKSYQKPPMLTYKIKQPDGSEVEATASPDLYTHIKWKLTKPVAPGVSGTVSFMVKVK
jgi:uncharacterized repeat protein (TIGR01451 family)